MCAYVVTVTGATGKTGRHVVEQSLARGWEVRAASRTKPASGGWVPWDWDDPSGWHRVFAGSDAAYILIPFNHPGAPEQTPALLRAAASVGVGRIVLLSSLDAEQAPDSDPLRQAELALQALPVRATIVRPTWFLDNFTQGSFAAMTRSGELRLPAGRGRIPFIDSRDVAAVAVAALSPEGPEGILAATGSESIDHHELAAAFSDAWGRGVTYASVSAEEFIQQLATRGFPRTYGEFLADALERVASGSLRIPVSDTVQRVTGRLPYTAYDHALEYTRDTAAD